MNEPRVDFIGIGAQKAATTFIAQCLSEHPDICHAIPKELHFFNKRANFYHGKADWKYENGIDWYLSHFDHCDPEKVRGEFSTHYHHDPDVPALIHRHFPGVKLLFAVRNPTERLISSYRYGRFDGKRRRTLPPLQEVIERYPEFVATGFYIEHIERFLAFFPRSQLKVLVVDDVEGGTLDLIQDAYGFLGVQRDFVPPSVGERVNETVDPDSFAAKFIHARNSFMRSDVRRRITQAVRPTGLPWLAKRILSVLSRHVTLRRRSDRHPDVDRTLVEQLNERYRPYNERLERFLDRDLPW